MITLAKNRIPTSTILLLIFVLFATLQGVAQENEQSNIQTYTPSKLLSKGQWDIKWFNNLYTQTKQTDEGSTSTTVPRSSFFTASFDIFTGVSKSNRVNVGLIAQIRSNTLNGRPAFDVFQFEDNTTDARSGFTAIAPAVKFQPFPSVGNFSIQTALFIPLFDDIPNAPYLDKRSYIWDTKFFYDKSFAANKFQFFGEVDFDYNFGESSADADPETENTSERFANNSLFLPVSAFLSYFPSNKFTVYTNVQQAFLVDLGNDFSQNYTLIGLGGKYQLNETLNLEVSSGKIIRGQSFQGLGQTFNLGLRALL